MYDRNYENGELEFETSGGLLNASLVMRDRQTDSWWSIMSGDAIGGAMHGDSLREIPGAAQKMRWSEWKALYPNSRVLSVHGREHLERNPYEDYFASNRTFRDLQIDDYRMKPKEPIYSFQHRRVAYAAAHREFVNGGLFDIENGDSPGRYQVFLYRAKGAPLMSSTSAYLVPQGILQYRDGFWWLRSGREGDEEPGLVPVRDPEGLAQLESVPGVERLAGFDTFWYNWVSVHRNTVVLE